MSAKYSSSKRCRKAGANRVSNVPEVHEVEVGSNVQRRAGEPRRVLLAEVQKWLPRVMDVGGLQDLLVQAVEGFATEAGCESRVSVGRRVTAAVR